MRFQYDASSRKGFALIAILPVVLALVSCSASTTESGVPGPSIRSEESDAAYLKDMSDAMSSYFGVADPPDVSVVRWVLPEEADDARRPCLEEAGFPSQPDGSYYTPEDQRDAWNLAQYTCWMSYPVLQKYGGVWEAPQVEIQYEWTVTFLVPCLEAEGFPIHNIPSKAKFIDSWSSAAFYPYSQVVGLATGTELRRLEKVCPQIAPSPVLWDGVSIDDYVASNDLS